MSAGGRDTQCVMYNSAILCVKYAIVGEPYGGWKKGNFVKWSEIREDERQRGKSAEERVGNNGAGA